jgi:hypothetical protein
MPGRARRVTAALAAVRTADAPWNRLGDKEFGARQGHSRTGEVLIELRLPPSAGLAKLHALQGRVDDHHREYLITPRREVQAMDRHHDQPGAVSPMRGVHRDHPGAVPFWLPASLVMQRSPSHRPGLVDGQHRGGCAER